MSKWFLKKIGRNVKENREKLELTQRELAEKSGIKRGSIAMTEIGKQNLPVSKLFQIAESLKIEAYELLK